MPENFRSAIQQLRTINVQIRQRLELAEASIPPLNELISQLGTIALAEGPPILGQVVYQQAYLQCQEFCDSALLYQAALLVPEGIGAAIWDLHEYLANEQAPCQAEKDARIKFLPFGNCGSTVKALLLGEVQPMLRRLFERFPPIN
ncbi:MAG TPA: hypothetical protein VHV55_22330 [Pirellulales bacterium]|jgi:hypothetical protein|nr:hypothetical protein [Pirellulales bacterium]